MLSRLLSPVLAQFALALVVLMSAGCARRAPAPAEPRLLAAVLDIDPQRSAEWSRTPQFALYDDGRFILRRDEAPGDAVKHSYWTGELDLEERAEVSRLIRAVVEAGIPPPEPPPAEWARLGIQPEPQTVLVFGGTAQPLQLPLGRRWSADNVHGLWEENSDLLRWLVCVDELRRTTRSLSRWEPSAMTVRLVRTRTATNPGTWPAKWPSPPLASPVDVVRELTLPIRSGEELLAASGGDGGIAWEGKFWHPRVFPVLPEARAWENFRVDAGDEPARGDITVWFETSPLAAAADRVWLCAETGRPVPTAVSADRDWIRRFAAALGKAELGRGHHCFCIGYRYVRFDRAGQPVLSVAAIHGNQLRIHPVDGSGGGDYFVSPEDWQEIRGLIAELAREGLKRPELPPTPWAKTAGAERPH